MAENKKKTEEMEAAAEQHESINGAELLEDEVPDGAEDVEEGDEALEGDPVFTGLYLMREKVKTRDKKEIIVYNIHGKIRDKDVIVRMKGPKDDYGARDVLDIIYGTEEAMPLYAVPYQMTDEKTKKVTSGFTYMIQGVVDCGIPISMKVIGAKESDKRLLECLIALEKVRSGEAKA